MAAVVTGLLVISAGSLFVIMGAYFALVGLSLYHRRVHATKLGAWCGLSAGLLAGAFSALLGIASVWAILR